MFDYRYTIVRTDLTVTVSDAKCMNAEVAEANAEAIALLDDVTSVTLELLP